MIKPLHDRVVVSVIEKPKTTAGGIDLLQDANPDAPVQGKILAVGPGAYNENGERDALEVAVGDVVTFQRDAGVQISTGTVVMRESEIIAIVG